MLSIYKNLKKNRFLLTEKRGRSFIIVEQNLKGDNVRKIGGTYLTRDSAEKALANYADDSGYRLIGRQDKDV